MSRNTIIFGDSYSTFEHYIPEGFKPYYVEAGRPETDVTKVSETWWYQVIEETNLNLILNNSWSGSTIGYMGYDNEDCSRTSSFIYRLKQLIQDDFFVQHHIDTVFVFGGTNDSWAHVPLGKPMFEDIENEDLYFVLPAICYFFKTLRETLPETTIYGLINTELNPGIVDCLEKVCEKYDLTKIAFDQIDKKTSHPTIQGMVDIKNKVLSVLNQ